ncbi:MAG TPA: sodium:proton antiporter NhaD, partial [Bacteroidales bacterium]|nr:sodium:proton antiporter NhaD [Bacteroidales bacterium]
MLFTLMIIVFIAGYILIALEHPLKINKSATAILLAVGLWVLFILSQSDPVAINKQLLEHLGSISEILFFLLGAMIIVELVDSHEGFRLITDMIHTTKKVKLLWIVSLITFFLSAVLDNLTTSIVMIALLRKLISDKRDRWFFGGMVIIAANSGGAFSPIGDVTTIMLWIAGHVTSLNIILKTFLPSLVSLILPLTVLSFTLKGNVTKPLKPEKAALQDPTTPLERNLVFFTGIGSLLFVPIFRTITHLPPYIGILGGLGILWVMTEIMHRSKNEEYKPKLTVAGVLRKIDSSTILFFLGILLAVAALESAGHLAMLADALDKHVGNLYVINTIIGLLSSVVDNVPLVAGAMGMYGGAFPTDHYFWEMLAYCAGTGGSILIIGSAAGVAVMGMEKIDFIWYLKKISLWALLGYLGGALVYWGL